MLNSFLFVWQIRISTSILIMICNPTWLRFSKCYICSVLPFSDRFCFFFRRATSLPPLLCTGVLFLGPSTPSSRPPGLQRSSSRKKNPCWAPRSQNSYWVNQDYKYNSVIFNINTFRSHRRRLFYIRASLRFLYSFSPFVRSIVYHDTGWRLVRFNYIVCLKSPTGKPIFMTPLSTRLLSH